MFAMRPVSASACGMTMHAYLMHVREIKSRLSTCQVMYLGLFRARLVRTRTAPTSKADCVKKVLASYPFYKYTITPFTKIQSNSRLLKLLFTGWHKRIIKSNRKKTRCKTEPGRHSDIEERQWAVVKADGCTCKSPKKSVNGSHMS